MILNGSGGLPQNNNSSGYISSAKHIFAMA
jgi:hypothetical protein